MQSLQRFTREGAGGSPPRRPASRDPPRGRRAPYHGGTADLYQPLDPGNGSGLCEDSYSRRRSRTCCRTTGTLFNTVVGVVLMLNAILIAVETDTGLLVAESVNWDGLEKDLAVLGADGQQRKGVESALEEGVAADINIKKGMGSEINQTLHRDVFAMRDSRLLDSGAYSLWEYLFLAIYILEMILRICDVGCKSYCADPWRFLDISIVILGVADLTLPYFAGSELLAPSGHARVWIGMQHGGQAALIENPSWMALTTLSCLRMARTLRVLRLMRLCPELKVISGAYSKAFATVLWVAILIILLDFMLAVVLTEAIGAKARMWDDKASDVDQWFGSLGRSMTTLFGLMTFSGWDQMATILGEVLPDAVVVPCIVLYILLVSFTTLSIVNGVIGDSFLRAQHEREKRHLQRTDRHRIAFAKALTNALSSCQQNRNGYLNRDGFKMALEAHPIVLTRLRQLEVHTSVDELLQLFDRLCQDSASDVAVEIDSLVEAITLLSANAKASEVFDLKYLVMAMRRETGERSSQLQYEVTQRHDEQAAVMNSTTAKVTKLQQELAHVKQDVAAARQEVASLHDELMKVQKRIEKDDREHRAALTTTTEKVDSLTAKVSAQESTLNAKIDALTATIANQADPEALISKLASDFASQFAAQFAAQLAVAKGEGSADEEQEVPECEAQLDEDIALAKSSGEPQASADDSEQQAPNGHGELQTELIDLDSSPISDPAAAPAAATNAVDESQQS